VALEAHPETLLTEFGLGIDVDVAQGSPFDPAVFRDFGLGVDEIDENKTERALADE
jgi:hypothetical protein